jgi:hypothetical protein
MKQRSTRYTGNSTAKCPGLTGARSTGGRPVSIARYRLKAALPKIPVFTKVVARKKANKDKGVFYGISKEL